ncbi:MAG: hypothetical protein O7H40_11420, partial [Gammaproteobacteria bacterium]|nr:hypothetical protein [Gammaproteobacteria bacterium]
TPMTAFFTVAALVSVGLAVIRDTRYAIVGGIAIGIYSFISFTVAVSSLLIGIFIVSLVFMGGLSMKRAWWITVYLLMSVSALWGGIYAITEFNIIDCLIISIENNAADMTQNPFDHGLRYFLRAFGNLLAYTGYLGAVISVCAVLGAFHARKGGVILRALAISTITSLLIASFSTLFYLETERIWVFLTPPMAILAAWGIFSIVPRRNFPTVATVVVTAALTASIAQEFFMTHYIPTDEYIDVNEYRYVRELLRER